MKIVIYGKLTEFSEMTKACLLRVNYLTDILQARLSVYTAYNAIENNKGHNKKYRA